MYINVSNVLVDLARVMRCGVIIVVWGCFYSNILHFCLYVESLKIDVVTEWNLGSVELFYDKFAIVREIQSSL